MQGHLMDFSNASNQGQPSIAANKIDTLTDQLQNLEISSPSGNFETVMHRGK